MYKCTDFFKITQDIVNINVYNKFHKNRERFVQVRTLSLT